MSDLTSSYSHIDFPWVSKSKIKSLMFCPYNFYLQHFVKEKVEKTHLDVKPVIGTNTHMIMSMFFDKFDPEVAFRNNDPGIPITRHPFRRYVYDTCMEIIPPSERDYSFYKRIYRNFATIETKHWLFLNSNPNLTKGEIIESFVPKWNEKFVQDKELMLYGTIDRISEMSDDKGSIIDYIFDYKTGNVPKQVRKGPQRHNNPYSWSMPTGNSIELHFYSLLYFRDIGCEVSGDVVDFLTKPEFFTSSNSDSEWSKLKKSKRDYLNGIDTNLYYPNGEVVENGDIGIGIMFLGDDEKPYVPIKKFAYRTLKSVYSWINIVRSIWYNKRFTMRPPYNNYKCKHCSRNESCLKQVQEQFT